MASAKQRLAVDAWIQEAQEASRLMEDLQLKLHNFNLRDNGGGGDRIRDSAQPKLLELGVKLDRLESLLRNPPCKPILTDEDLEFRWKMISDIQQRFRMAAQCLYASTPLSRPGSSDAADREGSGTSINSCDQDNRNITSSNEDPEMLTPLLSDGAKGSLMKFKDIYLEAVKRCAWNVCHAIGLVLGVTVLLLVLVVIVAAFQSMYSP